MRGRQPRLLIDVTPAAGHPPEGLAWPRRAPRNVSGEGGVSLPSTIQGKAPVRTELDLLQGTLDVLVLKAVSWGPRHGYAVAQWIRTTTSDELQIEEGALYTALHRLEQRRWLEAEWGLSE